MYQYLNQQPADPTYGDPSLSSYNTSGPIDLTSQDYVQGVAQGGYIKSYAKGGLVKSGSDLADIRLYALLG